MRRHLPIILFALFALLYVGITGHAGLPLFALATTAMCTSFKQELLEGGHCFLATQLVSATGVNAAFTLTGLASTANLAVGMAVTGTNVAAGAVIASIDGASQVTLSKAHTGAVTTVTFTADVFKMLLIKVSPTRTFDGTQTNVGTPGVGSPTASNVGTDETSGTGYTSGGSALTNVTPTTSGTTALTDFNPDPSWTSATFSATAAVIYNNSTRLGAGATPLNGRAVSVHDFGGTQTVSAGTFTVILPTADASNAILRLA